MKIAIGALAGLVVAGLAWAQPAAAQGWGSYQAAPAHPYAAPPAYGERRHEEPGYGGDVRERCIGLHREAENLRVRMDREWNPIERTRTEGRLREIREEEGRSGCRR